MEFSDRTGQSKEDKDDGRIDTPHIHTHIHTLSLKYGRVRPALPCGRNGQDVTVTYEVILAVIIGH